MNKFDAELYWHVRTTPSKDLNLTNKDLKRLETKLAIIDKTLPASSERWTARLLNLKVMRLRELNSLLSRSKIADLQDPFLRRQFVTQLYLLSQSPWIGLGKSIELSRIETISSWAERTAEQRLLNDGLAGILKELGFTNPTTLQKARINLKKIASSGILGLPLNLPKINKSLDGKSMRQDHAVDIYNDVSRIYGKAAMVVMIAVLYNTFPDLQKEIEDQINHKIKERENDPETIRKRDEAFAAAMQALDKVGGQIDQLTSQDPKQTMFEETLALFESMNQRKATDTEIKEMREQIDSL
ncbi:hypothetical protein [Bdellovibrio sp. KM01]|uniref:hypothetical protein n=1 Tax=Bdellovibrio sp. KM01 TaxID=2748865 RepID=UPI0015E9F72D|nr:hypothetical protein [Bdellovibrio sp. KM01]QLY25834.1 hypothetical protein HW988_01960 [Bdellovibrio sp. KM01]